MRKMVEWTKDEKLLINWFTFYVAARTVTKHTYQKWLDEIDQGPQGPRAQEMIQELGIIKALVEKAN